MTLRLAPRRYQRMVTLELLGLSLDPLRRKLRPLKLMIA